VSLTPEQASHVQSICSDPAHNTLEVDLAAQTIILGEGTRIDFDIDPLRKDDLLSARDAIAATLRYASDIASFELAHWESHPWLKPSSRGP
jgi:3-isopropylmalate/(R)-2-methylmalate dehydratase small subunit